MSYKRNQLVALLLAAAILCPLARAFAQETPGKATYDKYCSQCHGDDGSGEGIATRFVKPKPRDLTSGKYKIRSTPTGSMPTDDDLVQAIRRGLFGTAMPAFPTNMISAGELTDLVAYVKAFSADFEDPEALLPPIDIPTPPSYSRETATTKGREVYEATGCARCHGDLGRGDGMSAPTLVDDWSNNIRVADLTMPWTFRAGGTRTDIFRTMSTGFNGTPMPGFHGALPVEDIWAITDYIVALGGDLATDENFEAPYDNLVRAVGTEAEIDLALGDELFANAPKALFPIVGQIIEPGRNFQPDVIAVGARAVYNQDEIAFELTWNDMRAEVTGTNGPDLAVPLWDEQLAETGTGAGGGDDGGGDFWGEEDDGWGAEVEEDSGGDDFWGEEEVAADDVAADDNGGDDFWGEEDDGGASASPSGPDVEFSDAVALQFPQALSDGVRKPYFIFGDAQNPAELWFVDMGKTGADGGNPGDAELWIGRGSAAMAPGDGDVPEVTSRYENGEWTVRFKRQRSSRGGISFEEGSFVPVVFSVWDGFSRERGNKRGLTPWYDVYLEPLTKPSPRGPMMKAFFGFLGLEFLLIGLIRFLHRRKSARTAARPIEQTS